MAGLGASSLLIFCLLRVGLGTFAAFADIAVSACLPNRKRILGPSFFALSLCFSWDFRGILLILAVVGVVVMVVVVPILGTRVIHLKGRRQAQNRFHSVLQHIVIVRIDRSG